jgi:hypothetical protein
MKIFITLLIAAATIPSWSQTTEHHFSKEDNLHIYPKLSNRSSEIIISGRTTCFSWDYPDLEIVFNPDLQG